MASYTHSQTVASSVWTVVHNIGDTAVIIDSMVDDGPNAPLVEKILPSLVENVDSNTITITFSAPRTGFVRVMGNV